MPRRLWRAYVRPTHVAEAIEALRTSPPPIAVIAGGSDLVLDLQQGRHPAVHTLVDVTEIEEMRHLEVRERALFVGASVPLARIAAAPLVRAHALALAEAVGQMASPQIRNVATLGGNVAHALPAADGAIALLALDGRAEVASPQGRRVVPLTDLYLGPGKSALRPDELLVGFYLPLTAPGEASAFRRVMRPKGVALPILNVAVWLQRQGGRIAAARIAMGPFGPVPRRATAAEHALQGRPLDEEALHRAAEALLAEARFRTSPHRATAAYRRRLAPVLLRAALQTAWQRAASREETSP